MSGEVPQLSAEVLHRCYADARRCYPEESCGFLLGPRDAALCDEAQPCENEQNRMHAADPQSFPRTARTAYHLGGKDVLRLDRSLGGERPVKIIYHSHVEVGAYFSEEDRRAATFEGELIYPVDYLVIDCAAAGVRRAALFRYQGGEFVEIASYPGEAP